MIPAIDPSSSSSGAAPVPTGNPPTPQGATGSIPATISSLNQLEKESPKVYKAMMEGIAWNICSQLSRENEQFLKRLKEQRRAAGGD